MFDDEEEYDESQPLFWVEYRKRRDNVRLHPMRGSDRQRERDGDLQRPTKSRKGTEVSLLP